MGQSNRDLFGSKADFKIKLMYILVSILCNRKRCKKEQQRGRDRKPETSIQSAFSQELLSHFWIPYKAALRLILSPGSFPLTIIKVVFNGLSVFSLSLSLSFSALKVSS